MTGASLSVGAFMHDVGYWAGEFVLSLDIDYMHPAFAEFYDLSPADWTRATLTIGVDPPADLFFSAGGASARLPAMPSYADARAGARHAAPARQRACGHGLAGQGSPEARAARPGCVTT